jgi:Xaa-Pro aminopeptidase
VSYENRIDRARTALIEEGLDGMLLSVGADLPYFTGYEAMQTERLTMLVLPAEGEATLLVPELEAPRIERHGDLFEVRAWAESENPVGLVAEQVNGWSAALIGDHTWATFVIGLQNERPGLRLGRASQVTSLLRMRKDSTEAEALRSAAQATDRVVARLREMTFSELTERELSRQIAEMTIEEGHEIAEFGIVASGPNGASPHHESGERVMRPGDGVVIDFGGRFDGYHSDTTRTFVIGEGPDGFTEAFEVLLSAQKAACAAVQPGVTAESVDAAARSVITDAGYGDHFIHRTGHGIGLEVHEHPYIIEGNQQVLEPGMAFSIEPGIYIPDRFGMRIEDIVLVTDEGVERLNQSPRTLAVVG